MYVEGDFEEKYTPTIGLSIYEKELQFSKTLKTTFYFFDMGGLKSFAKIRRNFYNDTQAVLILFDTFRLETLENIYEWIEEAHHFIKGSNIPYFLIGNKIDLVENRDNLKNKAADLIKATNLRYFKTSALTGEGIDELFMYLALNC